MLEVPGGSRFAWDRPAARGLQEISLVRSTIRLIHSRTSIDLLKLFAGSGDDPMEHAVALGEDTDQLLAVLAIALEAQIKERGLDAERFADLLRGDELAAAYEALLRECADFSPIRIRSLIISVLDNGARAEKNFSAALLEKSNAVMDATTTKLLHELDANLEAILTTLTDRPKPSTTSSGGSPDDSAFTPIPTDSPNSADSMPVLIDSAGTTPPPS